MLQMDGIFDKAWMGIMNELTDLIQNMYVFFQKQYGSDLTKLGPGSLFLAFEKLATSVAASDFKLNPTDPDFNPLLVAQHSADLVDFVAQIDSEGFVVPHGDLAPTVTGQYDLLLSTAQPRNDSAAAYFMQIKGQARKQFDDAKASMDLRPFWAVSHKPHFWFNDQDPTLWSHYDYMISKSTQSGTPAPALPPNIILGNWQWRVLTTEAAAKWKVLSKAQVMHVTEMLSANLVTLDAPRVASASGTRFTKKAPISQALTPRLMINAHRRDDEAEPPIKPRQPKKADLLRVNPILLKQAALHEIVNTLPEAHVSSSNINLSLDYCFVDLTRFWISAPFLRNMDWYVPGLAPGSLASGTYTNNTGLFSFLPAKFIVIKNLNLTAQWSQQDRTYIESAASLGPFSLIDKTFSSDRLFCPGMQIIAWLLEVVPPIPPQASPAPG